jgi:hypothetical protein
LTKNRKWINKLKSALILDKPERLETLLKEKIEFSPEEFDEVKHLFKAILKNSIKKQMILKEKMDKIQNNINYRKSQLNKGKYFNRTF